MRLPNIENRLAWSFGGGCYIIIGHGDESLELRVAKMEIAG